MTENVVAKFVDTLDDTAGFQEEDGACCRHVAENGEPNVTSDFDLPERKDFDAQSLMKSSAVPTLYNTRRIFYHFPQFTPTA